MVETKYFALLLPLGDAAAVGNAVPPLSVGGFALLPFVSLLLPRASALFTGAEVVCLTPGPEWKSSCGVLAPVFEVSVTSSDCPGSCVLSRRRGAELLIEAPTPKQLLVVRLGVA